MEGPLLFGSELRRLRMQAGLTLQQLAQEMNYSKGHLSKIERGGKRPPMSLARRCDAYFSARGRLSRLAEPRGTRSTRSTRDENTPSAMARREILSAGVSTLVSAGVASQGSADDRGHSDPHLLHLFRQQLDEMRRIGQTASPAMLVPLLRAQVSTVTTLAVRAAGTTRAPLFLIAARFAEYTGWQAQEAGDDTAALRWTAEAVELARAGDDRHLADYALVRQALITFYNGAAAETVELARLAQRSSAPPRVRALAAQREAQGHALAGDEALCLQSLDRARTLFGQDEPSAESPVLGPTHLSDPAAMVTGWCLYDLGRPREAASALDRECERIPRHALRTRARYGIRRALAHAAAGEVEHSCHIAGELLPLLDTAPSATIRADIRRLDRELSRSRTQRAVRDLQPALARAVAAVG
ncbi:helix-turn-helix domain-containing protein [Streptomyces sp. NPDC058953]|uniref:helix-turn-helix domain-containing protein n=1 Tax=unclassified Streptomyces TaxID=2593676 RepID=UPI0036CC09B9